MPVTLPTELLSYILHLSAPLSYSPSSHSLRQYSLRNACLASKTLLALAQPLLAEVIVVDEPDKVKELMGPAQGGRGFGDKVKVLVVEEWKKLKHAEQLPTWAMWQALPAVCVNLTDLRFVDGTVDVTWLSCCLRAFSFFSSTTCGTPFPLCFFVD
jgi:hypothetical protein